MSVQNVYRQTLQNIIEQTDANQIQTSDQLLERLVDDLKSNDQLLQSYVEVKDRIYS